MIELAEFVEAQRELDSKLGYEPTQGQLQSAIIAEVGELVNELKYGEDGWVWWPREGKEASDRETIQAEAMDILHFLLIGFYQNELPPTEYEKKTIRAIRHKPQTPLDLALPAHSMSLLVSVEQKDYFAAIVRWCQLMKDLGFDHDETREGFSRSISKNRARWG